MMAEKCIKERAKDGMDGLLAVVVNFESLRFMTLIKEKFFISDLITEVEKTFTKLCSAKVTIKTLKNSVNAVLPDWYPVAPLIKNGDEIFAFSDAAADVLNINFSKPTNLSFSKYTPTDAKSSCGSTVPPTYDSGFGSRNEVGIVGTINMDIESEEQGAQKTNKDIPGERHTCPGLEKIHEHQNNLMEEDCENYSILSETFSLQKQYRNPVFVNNQNTGDEMLGKNKDKDSEREEETRVNQNVLSATATKGGKLDKSKKGIAGKSDLPKFTSSPVKTIGDTSEVTDSGRLLSVQRSEVPVAAKLPEQGPKAKKNLTKVAAKPAESRKRSASSSSSDSDDSSEDSSWQSDVSVEDKKEEKDTDTAKNSSSKAAQRSDNNAKTQPEKRTDKISKKTTAKTKTKSGQDVHNKSGSSDTSVAKLSNASKAIKIKIQNRSKNSNVPQKPVGDSQNNKKSENISTKVPSKNSEKSKKDSAHSESDSSESKSSKKSENVSTKIPSNSKKLGNSSEKDASNQPKFVSIKFTATENAQISEKMIPNTSESDSDSDSSWTGSSPSISPEKGPKTGSREKNGASDQASDSDNESDSNHNKTPATNLGKDKSDKNVKNSNDGTSTKKVLTPKAKAKPTEASSGSDDESSDSSAASLKRPLTQLPKDSANSKNGVDIMNMKNNNDGTSSKKVLTPKAKAKPTEASSGSDDESSDSSATLKRPLTRLPKDNTTSKDGVDKSIKNNNDGTSTNKQPTPKAKPTEASSGSDSESSDSSASLKRPLTQLPKDSAKLKNGIDVSPPAGKSDDEIDVPNLRPKSASEEKSPRALPKKNNNVSLLKAKSVPKTPSKSSRLPQPAVTPRSRKAAVDAVTPRSRKAAVDAVTPRSRKAAVDAVTPRSRKAAVDESRNKVASWLMANDNDAASVNGVGEEPSSSEEEEPEAPAQKSKKRTKKSRENKTSTEEKSLANGDRSGTNVQEGEDTNTGGGEDGEDDDKQDGKRFVLPPRVTRQSQKRKLNESTKNGTGGQSVSKNTKKNNKKGKKQPNKKKQTNSGSSQEKQDTSETDKNAAEQTIPKSQEITKRKATPLTLPKKSKGLSALLEDDSDDFQSSQPIKKPKLTPSWLDRQKPTGFLTPATSVERKSDKSATRSSKQRVVKKTSSSQPTRTTELNVSEKEFLSSGGVNLETLLDDENIQW